MNDITDFISQNTIATKPGRKCVDGRYLPNQPESGMIARPGGDLGYVMALLSLSEEKNFGYTPEECFDFIQTALQKMNENFYMHTDHHDNSPTTIGCGHAAKPINPDIAPDYRLPADKEQKLVVYAKQQAAQNPDAVKLVNLPGEHKEKAVIIVMGIEKTINSQDKNHMAFVYDKLRDIQCMEELVLNLNMPEITVEEFKDRLDTQTNATLHLLAKGLPLYEVNVDEEPEIKQIGVVE